MAIRLQRVILVALMVLAALLPAVPAYASHTINPVSKCAAGATLETTYQELASRPTAWSCSEDDWSISFPRNFIRFDLSDQPDSAGHEWFTTRLTDFDSMTISVIAADGRTASHTYGPDDVTFGTSDWLMSAPVPTIGGNIAAVIVTVDGVRHAGMLGSATLTPEPPNKGQRHAELLIAMLCGLLFMPLLFNLAFYRVLRQPFVLWHGAVVFHMLLHTFVSSGLINRFYTLSMAGITALAPLTWALATGSAAWFISTLMEPEMLSRRQHKLLRAVAPWVMFWTLFYLYADGPLRPLATPAYYGSFLPVLAVLAWSMATGIRRGSRAMRFQVAAWAPIMLTGAARVVTTLGATELPWELMLEQHLSLAFEVMITSIGVVDRFLAIKHQRDEAVAATKVLSNLAECDPLTGLLNRRAVRQRFDELRKAGYDTMAVLDLDYFKAINDSHGHTAGDKVLQSVARALDPDKDTLAVRLGGEEFLLLLRGPGGAERAERRRRAIPQRVASQNPGLHMPVTASMGVIIFGAGNHASASFAELYAHCDRLLYKSKNEGRNRSRVTALCEGLEPERMPVIALG